LAAGMAEDLAAVGTAAAEEGIAKRSGQVIDTYV